jgi:hypothetical protein
VFFAGLVFTPPFFAARISAFSDPSFSYLWQSIVLCVVCVPPCFLQRLQCFLVQAFLATLAVHSVLGLLFSFLPLLEAFLLDCVLDFSCVHTCYIASRDIRSEHMSTRVIHFWWSWNGPAT